MRPVVPLIAFLCPCLLGGCSNQPVPEPIRFIGQDPPALFEARSLSEGEVVFDWTFKRREDLSAWGTFNIDQKLEIANDFLALQSSTDDPQLFRDVELQANSIHVIQVAMEGLRDGVVQLFWAGEAEAFSEERSLFLTVGDGAGSRPPVYEFPVVSHPRWRGQIRRLRLDPTHLPEKEIQLHGITGLAHSIPRERLEPMVGEAWKVELDDEVRSAILAPAGSFVLPEIEVPPEGELRFGFGVLGGVGFRSQRNAQSRFRVLISQSDEQEPLSVFEEVVDSGDDGSFGHWEDRAVDLAAFAGERATLILETSETEPSDRQIGLPVWSNPEVISRRDGAQPPNVILISLDTLRADRLSLNGYYRETSPVIDAWAAQYGVNFQNAVVQAPWTLPSHVSLLTGLNAVNHRVEHESPAPDSLTMVAEVLRAANYATIAVTGGLWLRPDYGFLQGFDVYRYWNSPTPVYEAGELEAGLGRALELLEQNAGRPFFILFHTYEIHHPYRARQPFYGRFDQPHPNEPEQRILMRPRALTKETGWAWGNDFLWRETATSEPTSLPENMLPLVGALYDSGIAYADAQLGLLFRRIEELGLAEETLIVLTSDHGESLGEHGLVGHGYLYDDNLRVPLIIAFPGRLDGGQVIPDQVRSIDILPTILELTGQPPLQGIDGVSLVPLMEGEPSPVPPEAWSYAPKGNFGISLRLNNELKYIYNNTSWPPLLGTEELFRLRRDPGELENLAHGSPEAEILRMRVHQLLRARPGLRVRFANAGPGRFHGTIQGRSIHPWKVKAPRMPCNCVVLNEGRQMDFTVPTGLTYTLVIEDIADGKLNIKAFWDPETGISSIPVELNLDPAQLTKSRALFFTGSDWQIIDPENKPIENGITVWWEGGIHTAPVSPELDASLRQQLKALGYIR